ncbi:MAG: hypothetical protein LBT74_03695 [Acidobacteriota bacterium]|nr:hypothetical protein [Acidobacteriota bacterium]
MKLFYLEGAPAAEPMADDLATLAPDILPEAQDYARLNRNLILRPEDWRTGAPDPATWIDMLMRHLGVDYRISLLRAAASFPARRFTGRTVSPATVQSGSW